MPDKTVAPTEVGQDQGRGELVSDIGNDEATARRAKRKLKSIWYEDGGHYLCSYVNHGTTVFDVWKLIGEPLPEMGHT